MLVTSIFFLDISIAKKYDEEYKQTDAAFKNTHFLPAVKKTQCLIEQLPQRLLIQQAAERRSWTAVMGVSVKPRGKAAG